MFDDCIADMMEPYGGNTPLFSADKTDATVTIVQEAYDDGMKVTRISTPPRTETSVLMEAIDTILGIMDYSCPNLDKKSKDSEEGGEKDAEVRSDKKPKSKPEFGKPDKPEKSGGFGQADSEDRVEDKEK